MDGGYVKGRREKGGREGRERGKRKRKKEGENGERGKIRKGGRKEETIKSARRYRNQNQRKVDANVSWSGHFGKESDSGSSRG